MNSTLMCNDYRQPVCSNYHLQDFKPWIDGNNTEAARITKILSTSLRKAQ